MWAYSRTAFQVETLGELRPEPGLLLASTHRAETDVPVICPSVYRQSRHFVDRKAPRLSFAAREDMFDRGFFAGFPEGVSPIVRRLLFPLDAGPLLPRVRVFPIPYPGISRMRLGHALEAVPPETPLPEILPSALVEAFRARARRGGRQDPYVVADVRGGLFADILWTYCSRDELSAPALETVWQERAVVGASSIRRLIEYARTSGAMLLLFPEGRPSPDGAIGPLQPGLDLFVRRARPPAIAPLAIAYDPLTRGRPRAVLSFGPHLTPPPAGIADAVLDELRRTMPLTAGQVVADALLRAAGDGRSTIAARELALSLDVAIGEALDRRRPVESALAGPRRLERLSEALVALVQRGQGVAGDARTLSIDRVRLAEDRALGRLAVEFTSARDRAHASL